ncbi:helix-turn-helix domain-containing protein [Bacteroides sp. 51]|uniref:AraC family transcriptional regulator n=1 Tax=Bacteroides sp. 51 TaxID=2302938 RepID=UPI0013CFC218|nr:helix-turn-helix domain-containing protein [Bacteroides sp. 51]NDV82881.1 AraC family transcriptional regulator [Bacteroides sp. 51]
MAELLTHNVLSFASSFTLVILGTILMSIHILPDARLEYLRKSRKYLSFSYFLLGVFGFISFFLCEEAGNINMLQAFGIFISSYQALLFTTTVLTFIQPLYIKKRNVLWQIGLITVVGSILIIAFFSFSHKIYIIFFCIAWVAYLFQIICYVFLFRRKYKVLLRQLENYYDEEQKARLHWVKFCFYSATTIGLASLFVWSLGSTVHTLFVMLYTSYYAYMVVRFYNYQIDAKFLLPVITHIQQDAEAEISIASDDPSAFRYTTMVFTHKERQLQINLEQWVNEKKYLEKDKGVNEIVEELGAGDRYFLQDYFKRHMPTNFRTWRSGLRIKEAQRMISEDPDITLETVCEAVGFNHRSNFHQQFQKITGITPTEYKRRCKGY